MTLEEVLHRHSVWVDSDGEEGERAVLKDAQLRRRDFSGRALSRADLRAANLAGANLQGADLSGAELQGADLYRANLTNANLRGASLARAHLYAASLAGADLTEADLRQANARGADLSGAHLKGANLRDAQLRGAVLQDADFQGATCLLACQLAGTNTAGARLPEEIARFASLKTIEESSKITQHLFIALLTGCTYSLLTIATTVDARLITNTVSSPLPVIGSTIPIVAFYWLGPLILFTVYCYFHIYLQRLWESVAELPAIFPDGSSLHRKVYPWLLNGLARSYFELLSTTPQTLSRFQNAISIFLAWGVVPVTLLFFWGRYVPRHDAWGTFVHSLLLISSLAAGVQFYLLSAATLSGNKRRSIMSSKSIRDVRIVVYIATFVVGGLFLFLSFGAINNNSALLGFSPSASLRSEQISQKPQGWSGRDEDVEKVIGARLNGLDLRHASANKAFMVGTDLSGSVLDSSDFSESDLRRAVLLEASMRGASFRGANLRMANLAGADLSGADMSGARLEGADLSRTNLLACNFTGAHLRGAVINGGFVSGAMLNAADLTEVNLQNAVIDDCYLNEASLAGANLQGALIKGGRLQEAKLQRARMQGAVLQGANLKYAKMHQADLRGADLTGAELRGAELPGAKLEGAVLRNADLSGLNIEGADLSGADVSGAFGLSLGQFEQSISGEKVADIRYALDNEARDARTITLYRERVHAGSRPALLLTSWSRTPGSQTLRASARLAGERLAGGASGRGAPVFIGDLTGDSIPEILVSTEIIAGQKVRLEVFDDALKLMMEFTGVSVEVRLSAGGRPGSITESQAQFRDGRDILRTTTYLWSGHSQGFVIVGVG